MYIHVKVTAGAREECVTKKSKDHLLISVREKAERGQANRRVSEILSEIYGAKNIRLLNGHTSPSKLFSVDE